MKTGTKFILSTMNVFCWIIFIGLCIETGSMLYSYLVTLALNPAGTNHLYIVMNLSDLYYYNIWHYGIIGGLAVALSTLKAYIAYLVVKISLKFKIVQPFSTEVAALITTISHMALAAGILSLLAGSYCSWLMKKNNVEIPLEWASGEMLLFAGVIFIIAQVFKKGLELQTENELTV